MGRNRIFVTQETLDRWLENHVAQILNNQLCLLAERRAYALAPAVRFLRDVAETGDPHRLVGRVKEKRQLDELGAEHYMGSVVLGDSAYEVEDGFTAAPVPSDQHGAASGDIGAAVQAAAGDDVQTDEQLLTKFLLEKL